MFTLETVIQSLAYWLGWLTVIALSIFLIVVSIYATVVFGSAAIHILIKRIPYDIRVILYFIVLARKKGLDKLINRTFKDKNGKRYKIEVIELD